MRPRIVGMIVVAAAFAFASGCNPAAVESLVRQRWAGTGQEEQAVAVARCESGLRAHPPDERSYAGVMQMGRREWAIYGNGGDPHDPGSNIDAAFRYWRQSGWSPWSCRGAR